jgi:hypothetical protein
MFTRIGLVDGWHSLELLDERGPSLLWFFHPAGQEQHRSAYTGPSGALLTQMLSVESGVIERSRKPDPDPVAGEPSPGLARHLWLDF